MAFHAVKRRRLDHDLAHTRQEIESEHSSPDFLIDCGRQNVVGAESCPLRVSAGPLKRILPIDPNDTYISDGSQIRLLELLREAKPMYDDILSRAGRVLSRLKIVIQNLPNRSSLSVCGYYEAVQIMR